ncbi:hypothetical protein WJ28_05835 [Burkholderia thailandensis]|nr:hypothetical protein WJ27_26750 [Burkholderia thailandensis]KVG12208.1 hypothetical protein WJ25_07240 [Burkholderia thailandensis]KVG19074.1 hypothetical protein WJ28_05835 [Burkholderia thailandensis]NOK51940.1 hypothetical protein [Burkholderia thailandensis]PNE72632.1 hypothetical protein A8H38_11665 [Burkholderia thailandensis]
MDRPPPKRNRHRLRSPSADRQPPRIATAGWRTDKRRRDRRPAFDGRLTAGAARDIAPQSPCRAGTNRGAPKR